MKVLIFGIIPPPIGGISIHIERFYNYCLTNNIDIAVCDLKKRKVFYKENNLKKKLLFFFKSNIWHIHLSNNFFKIFIMFIGKILEKKIVYTHHNIRINNKRVWTIINFFADKIILVNKDDIDARLLNNKTIEIPAFVPPTTQKELPKYINEKLKNFDCIISANCFQFTLINGKDLYGFDLLLKAFYKISREGKITNTLLCLVDPTGTSRQFIDKFLVNMNFINGNEVFFIDKKIDFYTLIQKSNLIVRPTRSDGDSLTVREALYAGTTIICSDVVKRPNEAILFKNEDIDDLAEKIISYLNKMESKKKTYFNNFADNIIKIYKKI